MTVGVDRIQRHAPGAPVAAGRAWHNRCKVGSLLAFELTPTATACGGQLRLTASACSWPVSA